MSPTHGPPYRQTRGRRGTLHVRCSHYAPHRGPRAHSTHWHARHETLAGRAHIPVPADRCRPRGTGGAPVPVSGTCRTGRVEGGNQQQTGSPPRRPSISRRYRGQGFGLGLGWGCSDRHHTEQLSKHLQSPRRALVTHIHGGARRGRVDSCQAACGSRHPHPTHVPSPPIS